MATATYSGVTTISIRPSLAVLGAVLLFAQSCSDRDQRREAAPVGVVAQSVTILPDQDVVEAIGTARAARSAQLYAESEGRVVAVGFRPGAFVSKGQALLQLDAREERLALELAKVRVREAEQLLARYRRIEGTGALSASQIEAGETALAAAEVERDQASARLADMTLRAPFSGHISFTEIDIGDRVTPSSLIAQLDQRSTLFIEFEAPETVFSRLKPGQSVEVAAFAEPERRISARISAVDSNIGEDRRSYRVRTVIDNREDAFRPGMSFRVLFEDLGEPKPAVPEAAIVWGGEGSSIFIVRNNKAVQIPVTIASRRDGLVLLEAKIDTDALVVVEGVQKIRDGQSVELVEPRAIPATNVELSAE